MTVGLPNKQSRKYLFTSIEEPNGSVEGVSIGTLRSGPSIGSIPDTVRYSFFLFVLSIPYQNVELPYLTDGAFSLANLSGLLFLGAYLFHVVLFQKAIPGVPRAMRWFIAYFLIYSVSGLIIDDEAGRAYFNRLLTLIQILGFFWCASDLLKDERFAKGCLLVFALGTVVLAVATLLHLPGFAIAEDDRAATLGMNPNRVASLMVSAALILSAFCLNESRWSTKRKLIVISTISPLLALLVSTGSRAGIGAFLIGVSIFLLIHGELKRKIVAAIFVGMAVLVILFLIMTNPDAARRWERTFDQGDSTRTEIYRTALEIVGESPVIGWGESGFVELGNRLGLQGRRDAHNFILYLLIQVGLIGAVPFLVGLTLCLWAAWKARAGPLGILPLTILVSTISAMATHTGLTAKTLWLFLSLALAAVAMVKGRVMVRRNAPAGDKLSLPDQERARYEMTTGLGRSVNPSS